MTANAARWAAHHAAWRDPSQLVGHWWGAPDVDKRLLAWSGDEGWWDTLADLGITLLVTREYEHLVVALSVVDGRPFVTYLPMPHPSGLAVDRRSGHVSVASTRNPNQVFELAPVVGVRGRADLPTDPPASRPLVPVACRFYPGCLYTHDLAYIGGQLHANAVGLNAVVRLCPDGRHEPVWWPRSVDGPDGPHDDRNYLQLNSIAAGVDIAGSFFSASVERPGRRRPGHRDFAVDRRGVVFSGTTREPVVRGLTRPHSARLLGDQLWVADSGYGRLGFVDGGAFHPVASLPGWTRGLCFHGRIAFVGTSRVIPRFRRYAPGLDVDASVCALHALDTTTGRRLGSLRWPHGNQIFAIDWLPGVTTRGFPFAATGRRARGREDRLFYAFST